MLYMDQEKIGKMIKNLRVKSHLTQQEFATKYGVTYQAVSKWENGKNIPDILVLKEISKDYQIPLEDFLEAKENGITPRKESKKDKGKKYKILLFLCILGILGYFLVKALIPEDFVMKPISSSCDNFEVFGSIAYNSKKSDIYISNISYCGKRLNQNKYQKMKCTLYEVDGEIKKEISSYNYQEKDLITLEVFLKKVSFHIDDYSKTCKTYSKNSLNLEIEAIDPDEETTFYKIPLTLEECNH